MTKQAVSIPVALVVLFGSAGLMLAATYAYIEWRNHRHRDLIEMTTSVSEDKANDSKSMIGRTGKTLREGHFLESRMHDDMFEKISDSNARQRFITQQGDTIPAGVDVTVVDVKPSASRCLFHIKNEDYDRTEWEACSIIP